jgi:hypothetical protein
MGDNFPTMVTQTVTGTKFPFLTKKCGQKLSGSNNKRFFGKMPDVTGY